MKFHLFRLLLVAVSVPERVGISPALNPENTEWFIEDQALSMSYNLAPRPPSAPLSREQVVSLSQSFCVPPIELTDGGRGEEPNHATARSLYLTCLYSFNTLCLQIYRETMYRENIRVWHFVLNAPAKKKSQLTHENLASQHLAKTIIICRPATTYSYIDGSSNIMLSALKSMYMYK